jgi:hypothetical protein
MSINALYTMGEKLTSKYGFESQPSISFWSAFEAGRYKTCENIINKLL